MMARMRRKSWKTVMYRAVCCLLLVWTATAVRAQFFSHSLIYSTDSTRFTVYLDGQKINPQPRTRVRCINLDQPYYKLRIVFEDKSMEPIERQRFFLRDTYGYPVALEHQLKRSKKGDWKMKWRALESWPGKANPDADSFVMPDPDKADVTAAPCNGKTADVTAIYAMLENTARLEDEARLLVEKQFVSSNCVTVAGLSILLQTFAQDSQRLELARYAYTYTVDPGNYHELNKEFKNPKSVEELYRAIAR